MQDKYAIKVKRFFFYEIAVLRFLVRKYTRLRYTSFQIEGFDNKSMLFFK